MARAILCAGCGVIKPTHPEDAARGLFQSWVSGLSLRHVVCDSCNLEIKPNDKCVAWSQPAELSGWEHEYVAIAKGVL